MAEPDLNQLMQMLSEGGQQFPELNYDPSLVFSPNSFDQFGFADASTPFSPQTPLSPASMVSPHPSYVGAPAASIHALPQSAFHPPTQQFQQSTQVINHIIQVQQRHNESLENIRQRQVALFSSSPSEAEYRALSEEQQVLLESIDQSINKLNELLQSTLLDTNELYRVTFLQNELGLQRRQLELYHFELQQLVGQNPGKPLVFLVTVQQPFPNVLSKLQQLTDGELTLRLLTGAAVTVNQVSPVKAAMIIDSHQAMRGDHKMIANDTQLMDQNHVVKFPLQFCEGTRKSGVHLRFAMQVRVMQNGATLESTIESDSTQPLVVMTNQKQWEACERTLLLRDAFNGQLEVSWFQFANALQRQFVRSTKQDSTNPTRCLSTFDFTYLHNKFFGGRRNVHQRDFDNFWTWYGKCIQVIRFQRHILQLWQTGLLYGFMTREDVDAALRNRTPGNFVIRFSERHSGQFGIAYVGSERPWRIKHYLVQPNDTAAAKFTLPDFCRDKGQFVTLLQYSLNPITGTPQFTPLSKDVAFEPYYSRRIGGDTSGSGYEPLG